MLEAKVMNVPDRASALKDDYGFVLERAEHHESSDKQSS